MTAVPAVSVAHPHACCHGPQVPQSDAERVVACLCMITGAAVFAYVLGAISGIVNGWNAETQAYVQLCRPRSLPALVVVVVVVLLPLLLRSLPSPTASTRFPRLRARSLLRLTNAAALVTVCDRFHADMDHLNAYMDEYRLPLQLRQGLRKYFIHCRYAAASTPRAAHDVTALVKFSWHVSR